MVFDWLKMPFGTSSETRKDLVRPSPPIDSDGRRRIFGESVFAKHGDFLQKIGFKLNDPENILPNAEGRQRAIQSSFTAQGRRRAELKADLLANHGCNAIQPFFLFAEHIYNSDLGDWMISCLRLMPYDDWNTIYLPTDRATSAALNLPLHPQQSFVPVDKLLFEFASSLREQFEAAYAVAEKEFKNSGNVSAFEHITGGVDRMRASTLDKAREWMPMIVKIIADISPHREA